MLIGSWNEMRLLCYSKQQLQQTAWQAHENNGSCTYIARLHTRARQSKVLVTQLHFYCRDQLPGGSRSLFAIGTEVAVRALT